MNDQLNPRPTRTLQDIVREMRERAVERPIPLPPTDAPIPPPSHHDPKENDREP